MRLSQRADYGLAVVIYLAQKDIEYRYSMDEISEAISIPEEFLRKIIQTLVKVGIVDSFRGRGGGISLAQSSKDITIFQVIEPLEQQKGLVRCVRGEYCPRSQGCPASEFWRNTQKRFFDILKKTTIKDLVERRQQ